MYLYLTRRKPLVCNAYNSEMLVRVELDKFKYKMD